MATESLNPKDHRPQTLYRMYDKYGVLLYIGVSVRAAKRFQEHSEGKDWWGDVDIIKVQHYPSRVAAEIAEINAILEEKPRYNKAFNRHEPTHIKKPVPDYNISLIPRSVPDRLVFGAPGDKSDFTSLLSALNKYEVSDEVVFSILWNCPKTKDLAKEWGEEFVWRRIGRKKAKLEPYRGPIENPPEQGQPPVDGVVTARVSGTKEEVRVFFQDAAEIELYIRQQGGRVSKSRVLRRFAGMIRHTPREVEELLAFLTFSGAVTCSCLSDGDTVYEIAGKDPVEQEGD